MLLLLGCTPAKTPIVAAQPTIACPTKGRFAIAPGATLAIAGVPRLRFRGAKVDAGVSINGAEKVSAVIRSGGFRFGGMLEARDVPIRATRQIPIVAGHIWIEEGVPLGVSPGLRVTSHYTEGLDVVATATCEQIGIGEKTWWPKVHGTPYHLAHATFDLLDAPSGRVVAAALKPRSEIYTLWTDRADKGYVHVLNRDWISVDGWVKETELLPGEGGDCDDCRGSIMDAEDRCPDDAGEDDIDGCPEFKHDVGKLAKDVDVVGDKGETLGSAEAGAEIVVLERKNGRARVVPRGADILPVNGGWWIAEPAITPSAS
jgi:hypothetical protein